MANPSSRSAQVLRDADVLRGVNLDIERRKMNIIIGGSGQGKSVLMKHLMGLLAPDSGHIFIDGVDIIGLGEVAMGKIRRKFGMVFQYAALFDSMNVVENIAFPLLERYRLSKAEVMERVRALLTKLDLAARPASNRSLRRSFLVACASEWAWRERSSIGRRFCSTMSRQPGWTPSQARMSTR